MKNLNLTENLILTSIEENNFKAGKLIAVTCYFQFYGKQGIAYVVIDKLNSEYPRYGMIEITSELSDSFNSLLEDEENWKKIVRRIKSFKKEWDSQNKELM